MRSLSINLMIAVIWLLLSRKPSSAVFAIGFLIGFILLAAFRPILGSHDYVRRSLGLVQFFLIFTREFVVANLKVAWTVLFRSKESLHPNFITYDVSGMSRGEILLLTYCITLTPGTTSVNVSEDFNTLMVHALDADDPEEIRAGIDNVLRRSILAFTR
jgi:multicomponent Na+:H+ antiporter subunit E